MWRHERSLTHLTVLAHHRTLQNVLSWSSLYVEELFVFIEQLLNLSRHNTGTEFSFLNEI